MRIFLACCITLLSPSLAMGFSTLQPKEHVAPYPVNPYVSSRDWNEMIPYFLPADHPIRPILDQLFASRVVLNSQTLAEAGFINTHPRPSSFTIVTKHPALAGYFIKLYADDQEIDDHYRLLRRVEGMKLIKDYIERHKLQNYLTVPNKWIYPLPAVPAPFSLFRKNFIIIAEDMKIASKKSNLLAWKSLSNKKFLKILYKMIKSLGLADSNFPSNIPFLRSGKGIVFIDTEIYHSWPCNALRLGPYLSSEMEVYWQKIVQENP